MVGKDNRKKLNVEEREKTSNRNLDNDKRPTENLF